MQHCSENELVELVEGRLAESHAEKVATHVAECDACRIVVAELARDEHPAEKAAPSAEVLPRDLLREYLQKDARVREITATRAMAWLSVFGLVVPPLALLASGGDTVRIVVPTILLVVLLAYQLLVLRAMRRGWFHPAVSFVNASIEVTTGFAFCSLAAIGNPAEAMTTPFQVIKGAIVVFTAVRTTPWLSICAGALAFVQELALHFAVRHRIHSTVDVWALSTSGSITRASLFLLCGIAAAVLAGQFVRRAEEALREIREQDLFGKYLLLERLGGGGMGEVFRATYCPEGGFVRTVAVKRLRATVSDDPRFAEAFREEARLCAMLSHPNLVQVLDCGRFRGSFVFAMELVDGPSFRDLLRARKPLHSAAVAHLGSEIAAGLAYLHERRDPSGAPLDLVHCDLNPPNILISRIGEVKIADFGIARSRRYSIGREGTFAGKAQYAAPEQLRGEALDGRADLFALGLMMHEALTGKRVFAEATDSALGTKIPSLPNHVPDALCSIVMHLLALDREGRPPCAWSVRESLLSLSGDLAPRPNGERALTGLVQEHIRAGDPEKTSVETPRKKRAE